MWPMLSRGRVDTVATEVSQRWLKPQGCSSEELLVLLSRAGFKVDLRADAPSCMFDMGYGCDIMVDWARDAAAPCQWNHHAMADGSYKCV